MFRQILNRLLRVCRRVLSHLLPLTVGEWIAVGAFSAATMAGCYLFQVWLCAPDEPFQIYWRLKWYNFWGNHAPEFELPEGKSFRSWGPYCTVLYEGMLAPYLHEAERKVAGLFPFFTLWLACIWAGAKGHSAGMGEHIRGNRILPTKELAAATEKEENLLPLGPVRLPRKYEEKHLVVAGDRVGRGVVFTQQLDAIRRSALPAVVYDPGGEYLERFYLSGVDHIANPLDERGFCWNLFDDLENVAELSAFANCVVPGSTAAQNLLRGLVLALCAKGKRSNADLWEALNASHGTQLRLCASVEGGEAACRLLESPYSRETEMALALLRSRLSWLEFSQGKGNFSLNRWLADPKESVLFLTSPPELEHLLRPLATLLVALLISRMLNRKERGERVFFLLDDLAGLGFIPGLKRLVPCGREAGAALLLGVRDLAGLECSYDSREIQTILNGCETLLVLKLADGRTANFFAWRFGEREYWDAPDLKVVKEGDRFAWSLSPRTDWLLLGAQIQQLSEGSGLLILPTPYAAQVEVACSEANRLPAKVPCFVLRQGFSLNGLQVRKVRRSEREVQLGFPLLSSAPGGPPPGSQGGGTERTLSGRLEF
jgi:hypothetical protein